MPPDRPELQAACRDPPSALGAFRAQRLRRVVERSSFIGCPGGRTPVPASASKMHSREDGGRHRMQSQARSEELTLLDLVLALDDAADSPREVRAALDHLLATRRVSFKRPAAMRRLGGGPRD